MCSGAGSFVQDKVVGRREAQPAVLDVSEVEWKANDAGEEPSQRTCVCVCVFFFFGGFVSDRSDRRAPLSARGHVRCVACQLAEWTADDTNAER